MVLDSVLTNEQLLDELVSHADDLIFVCTADNETIFANRAARAFLNTTDRLPDVSRLTRALKWRLQSEQEKPAGIDPDLDHMLARGPSNACITEVRDATGNVCYFYCKIIRISLDSGAPADLHVFHDISETKQLSHALARKTTELIETSEAMDALNEVTVELINHLDLNSLFKLVAKRAAMITNADFSYVSMVNPPQTYLEIVAVGQNSLNLRRLKHAKGEGIAGECWQQGKTVSTSNYQSFSNRLAELTEFNQACAVPIIIENKVIGVLGGAFISKDVDIQYQSDILEKFARLVAVAIENTKLHKKNKVELDNTEAISKLSQSIHGANSFPELLDSVCITMIKDFKACKAQVYKYDSESTFTPVTAWEMDNGKLVSAEQIDGELIPETVGAWCIENQETAWIKHGVTDSRETARVHKLRRDKTIGPTVCIPLAHNRKSWGILFIHRRLSQLDFSRSDINLFNIIGNQTSVALHRHDLIKKIQHQAYHDSLTALPNRFAFESKLQNRIQNNPQQRLSVLFIDLDGFKGVNDRLGHPVGDTLLRKVTERFRQCLAPEHTLARLGGDEFAAVFSGIDNDAQSLGYAQKLIDSISGPIELADSTVDISASIGISHYPAHASDPVDLLHNADIAMYEAKSSGKGVASIFSPQLARSYEYRLSMESDIKRALEEGEFELYFQPKVSCNSSQVQGVEALMRWQHPEKGFISPAEFIPIAEDSGLIQRIGPWVVEEACRQLARFIADDLKISVAINISAQQFASSNFISHLRSNLERYHVPYSALEIEVTESVVMKDVPQVVKRLTELRQWGIKIAIDDFGTGYSSLKYLDDLPLDILKIDKAFVDKLQGSSNDKSLVKTIVVMAKSFGLKTVAEGVESLSQVEQIKALGCDYIQGYYYAKPVPAGELADVLGNINSRTQWQAAS